MNQCFPLRRFNAFTISFGFALFFFAIATSAYAGQQEQQSSQSAQQQQDSQPPPQPPDPSAPKPKKVWTNDEVIQLRSPADAYVADKEAREAADAKAAAQEAALMKQIKAAELTMKLPSTPEETQRLIASNEERIRGLRDELDQLNNSPNDASEVQKAAMHRQIDQLTANLEKKQFELKVLQDYLKGFTKTPTSEPPSGLPVPPPVAPSPENPQ
jgi:hypothetical protein